MGVIFVPVQLSGFDVFSDTVDETETEVKGYETPCEFSQTVRYVDNSGNAVDISQLIPLVDSSRNCRQLVKWRCWNAAMNKDDGVNTCWRNRNGDAMAYFGNAAARSADRCDFASYATSAIAVVVAVVVVVVVVRCRRCLSSLFVVVVRCCSC